MKNCKKCYLVAHIGAAIGGLKRVGVDNAHVAQHYPTRRLLGPGEREPAVLKIEPVLGVLVEQEGEDLLTEVFLAPFPVLTSVHEHVVLPGVGMEVAVEVDGAILRASIGWWSRNIHLEFAKIYQTNVLRRK